jgi:hypothetical protein
VSVSTTKGTAGIRGLLYTAAERQHKIIGGALQHWIIIAITLVQPCIIYREIRKFQKLTNSFVKEGFLVLNPD